MLQNLLVTFASVSFLTHLLQKSISEDVLKTQYS